MKKKSATLTHIDPAGHPAMVDVSAKPASHREAVAECRVRFPAWVATALREAGMATAKGAVVDTAIIAGTMAVKRTPELIPFCHPLPIDGCRLEVDWCDERTLRIECAVKTTHRTGVEMEALTGATVAALTVYDMAKALSHAIVVGPAKLVAKRGGKREIGEGAGMSVTVLYFASLRDAAGVASEQLPLPASLGAFYEQLRERHGFALPKERLRVAVDGAFSDWGAQVSDGAEIAFIPPVSGG